MEHKPVAHQGTAHAPSFMASAESKQQVSCYYPSPTAESEVWQLPWEGHSRGNGEQSLEPPPSLDAVVQKRYSATKGQVRPSLEVKRALVNQVKGGKG